MPSAEETVLVYRVDPQDRLCAFNSAWTDFARANEGEALLPEHRLGTSLWPAVKDAHVREIYRRLMQRARAGHPVAFGYRCDAPEWRRWFHMEIRAVEGDGSLEFISRLLREERRPRVALLDLTSERSTDFVTVCSWCQRVSVGAGLWQAVEQAVEQLGLLNQDALPGLTHGICGDCKRDLLASI